MRVFFLLRTRIEKREAFELASQAIYTEFFSFVFRQGMLTLFIPVCVFQSHLDLGSSQCGSVSHDTVFTGDIKKKIVLANLIKINFCGTFFFDNCVA